MWSVAVILIFFDVLKTFFPLVAFPGNVLYWTRLNSASSSWGCLICCFYSSIIPSYCVSTLTFCKCGATSQSADTADADADEDVDVVLESICFSCPPTIVDEQCKVNVIVGVLIWKKMKSCVAHLWLTQPFGTNVQMACLDLKWNHVFFQQQLQKYWGFWYAYFLGVLKPVNCLYSCNFSHVVVFLWKLFGKVCTILVPTHFYLTYEVFSL